MMDKLQCDQCQESYPSHMVYLNEQGQFMCGFCLEFYSKPALLDPKDIMVENPEIQDKAQVNGSE